MPSEERDGFRQLPLTPWERAQLLILFREAIEAGDIPPWADLVAQLRARPSVELQEAEQVPPSSGL